MTLTAPLPPPSSAPAPEEVLPGRGGGRAAVVINPTVFARPRDVDRLRAAVAGEFVRQGWRTPLWLPTTAHTRGWIESRFALAAGVDVVLVAGGDGTVREVARELIGTGVPLTLLPVGTGNLLARELGMPLRDATAAVRTACEGLDAALDVGVLALDRADDGVATEEHLFLVMAGAGFAAELVAGANPGLKRWLGRAAYLVSALRALIRHRDVPAAVAVRVDGRDTWARPVHGVLVGSCGTLTAGLPLLRDADTTDGVLDAVAFLPGSATGWARVARSVVVRDPRPHALLPRVRGEAVQLSSDVPLLVQVDGDVVGRARRVRWEVRPSALVVRHPVPPAVG